MIIKISQGNLPLLTDTLTDETGNPADLSTSTVIFNFQGVGVSFAPAATVVNAVAGMVSYQFVAPQTALTGFYQGQWQVTDGTGGVRSFPTRPFSFEIIPALPLPGVTSFAKLSDLYDDVRALTGDFKRQLYEDSAIASVMRTQLRLGRVKESGRRRANCDDGAHRWTVGPDGQTISPAILDTDIGAYSLLIYHTALALVTPNLAAYSYRTRALSERFGEQKDFLAEFKLAIYELEDGGQTYASVSGLRSTLFAVNGIFVWSYLQMENNINLSFM
jgi:hypothetical protein